ncbi:hypothetical protein ACIBCA_28980 [Kitasatospora sp. NPDC051170]|uniref:hypothetical protein n=1 Tax=Kitasatospora sp. NPDC051170 TaxID=3364056 RepID=UPI0037A306D0
MAPTPSVRLFDAVESRVARPDPALPPHTFRVTTADGRFELTPADARDLVHGPGRTSPLAQAVWRFAVLTARSPESPPPWDVLPVWLALPRLRSAVHRIHRRLRTDRNDLEAAAVLGVIEGSLRFEDTGDGLAGERVMRTATGSAWRLARQGVRERTVPHFVALTDRRDVLWQPPEPGPDSWELQISPPDRPDGLTAPLHFTVSRERLAGERLGAMAVGIGLHDIVHRARRPRAGRRIGTLSLRPAGSPR